MNNLKQVISLIKKGDRLVVVNEQAEPQFVIMSVLDYEKIRDNNNTKGLTEEELLVKINRDIAIWKNDQADDESDVEMGNFFGSVETKRPEIEIEKETDSPPSPKATANKEDKYYFEPVDDEEEKKEDES